MVLPFYQLGFSTLTGKAVSTLDNYWFYLSCFAYDETKENMNIYCDSQ